MKKELTRLIKSKNSNLPRSLVLGLQWVSLGYSSALYFAGKKIGKEIASNEIKNKEPKEVFKGTIKVFKNMGLGSLSIKSVKEKNAVLILKDGTTAHGMARIGKTVCYFEAGLISGILEAKIKKVVNVSEVSCGGLGDSIEEFVVKF